MAWAQKGFLLFFWQVKKIGEHRVMDGEEAEESALEVGQ